MARRGGLSEAELDGELLGLHVEQGTCYGFNGTATRVWKMIAQPTRLSALRDALLRDYDVDTETCERDLRGPGEPRVVEEEDVDVYIKHRGPGPGGIAGTVHTLPRHPGP